MTRIVIAGAGGFGRGLCSWLHQSPRHREEFGVDEVVYIDDTTPLRHPHAPVVSTVSDYRPREDDRVVCAIGSPRIRWRVIQLLRSRSATFHTFVDDTATVGIGAQVHEGAVICPGSVLSADVVVGEHVHINFNCCVGHDTVLGAYTTLSPAVNIMGEVVVGEGAFFGGNCAVLPRLSVGAAATVAAGATVIDNVPDGATVVGNPARTLPQEENR